MNGKFFCNRMQRRDFLGGRKGSDAGSLQPLWLLCCGKGRDHTGMQNLFHCILASFLRRFWLSKKQAMLVAEEAIGQYLKERQKQLEVYLVLHDWEAIKIGTMLFGELEDRRNR